ncbi:MAG TPA: septal ring lytic transglycosylase RlpA family protein [Solirubrobacteraceae bacterium]|jgi:rare lipoprotein A (peptidoglycan hydrolase)|nr:septal ring lytic transglycosylase RlpA family protein [Solirubrobacteraceae bacterium]
MRTAFSKHALLAGLSAVFLGVLASLAAPTVAALADITGGASPTTTPNGTITTTPNGTIATWFGPGFYGHMTACGQKMSPKLVGVASRTLPCGTLVQVTYHGRHLTVPVLDRGPYGHTGATWDLTSGAARTLEIRDTVHITTEIMGSMPNSPTLGLSQSPAPFAPGGAPAPTTSESTPSTAPAAAATTGGATAG